MANRIKEIFGIEQPVIAGGMAWCSGWRLAAAVSNAGGLGLIGAGTMSVDLLREHIQKIKAATTKPWGINLPLMYPQIDSLIDMIIEEGCKIVFTSAGSPKKYTQRFHDAGMTVAHVVSSSKFAKKCEEAGVDVEYHELKDFFHAMLTRPTVGFVRREEYPHILRFIRRVFGEAK